MKRSGLPLDARRAFEFPSMADARAWHDSPEYAGPRALRDKAVTVVVVEGV